MEVANANLILSVFLGLLFAWSSVWFVLSSAKFFSDKNKKVLWATHLGWSVVNISIAAFGFYTVSSSEMSDSFVTSQRNIVAFNILLDIVYVLVALKLMRSTKEMYVQIGRAVRVQGAFLFFFDIVFALALTIILL